MPAQIDKNFRSLSFKKTFTRYLSYALYEGRPLTTKGRWINPLVFFLYRIQSVLPTARKVQMPVFILGTGRSGTTILGVSLGIHREVGFLNEPKAFWSFLYDKEDLIGSYQRKEAYYRLDPEIVTSRMKKKAHRIYGNYLRFAGAKKIVDKYPELIFRTEFVKKIFPDARFLFLYRNGDDTIHSINIWSQRKGEQNVGETHDWWGRNNRKWGLLCQQIVAEDDVLGSHADEISRFEDHVHRAATEWIVTMKEGIRLMDLEPETVLGVRYEDYVGNQETRNQVLEFCGLGPDPKFDQYCEKVLKPVAAKPAVELPESIAGEYDSIMRKLEYR